MENKRNVVMIVIGGLVALVFVVGIAVGTAMLVTNRLGATPTQARVESTSAALDLVQLSLDPPFVTNLKDEGKPRYIELGVTVLVKDEKIQKRLADAKPILQDTVLTVLASKYAEDVQGEAGKNQLAADLTERLNKTLGGEMIEKVLFTKLVVQ